MGCKQTNLRSKYDLGEGTQQLDDISIANLVKYNIQLLENKGKKELNWNLFKKTMSKKIDQMFTGQTPYELNQV